jgi:hypothetical protein
VDGSGNVLPIDPYSATATYNVSCNGYDARALLGTDTVPYYHWAYNQSTCTTASCRWYAYSYLLQSSANQTLYVMDKVLNPTASGTSNTWYINPHYYPGNGQYDTYAVNAGYMSTIATRDGGGYDQIFWGSNGTTAIPYNGWLSSSTASFASPVPMPTQTAQFPISGDNWEQKGSNWPDPTYTPNPAGTSTTTTWYETTKAYDSGKTMLTLVSQHQSQPQPLATNPGTGHMEIWYYTQPYGATRWESWSAANCNATTCPPGPIQYCTTGTSSPRTFSYNGTGTTYYLTDCKDYSFSAIADTGATVPNIPSIQQDVLLNPHYSNDASGTTNAATNWTYGGNLTTDQLVSTYADDQNGFSGLRYLQASCTAACTAGSSISQSVSLSGLSAPFSFGAEVRTETATGSFTITLAQTASGSVITGTTTSYNATVSPAGDSLSTCTTPFSVLLCAQYVGGLYTTPLASNADHILETITFGTGSVEYDLDEAYLGQVHQ